MLVLLQCAHLSQGCLLHTPQLYMCEGWHLMYYGAQPICCQIVPVCSSLLSMRLR